MFNFFKKTIKTGNRQKLNLRLSGLHCTACAVNIDLALEDLEGIANSTTNYARSLSVIEFDPEKIDPVKISAEIKKLGYQAESL